MMENSVNSWRSGMDKDLSKTSIPANKYTGASNFRVTTDKGGSSTSLENIKGNLFNKSIPDIGAVQKISIAVDDITQTIQINTSAVTAFNTTNKKPIDLYNIIKTFAEFGVTYNAYYNSLYVLIVPVLANTVTVTLTGASGLVLDSNYIPAQTNLEVIGNTSINDDIYILTTNSTAQAPTASAGQIWKLIIDDVTNTSTLSLIYNNIINFSTYNAIAPTAITGRYENGSIQRIYWTDFYNKIRQLNIADPQAFAVDISLLELTPSIDFDIPLLTEFHEGGVATLKVGVYQMAYRFKNTTGSVTQFSPLSNIVSVTTRNESIAVLAGVNNFYDYIGDIKGTLTDKIMSWTINNIDPDFDTIECIILIRETKDEAPTIYSFHEESISGRQSLTVTCSGDILDGADVTTLSLSEFLSLSGIFTHAKTLTTKDNRLIFGNIKTQSLDIDFDARVYRFDAPQTNFNIIENGVVNNYNTTNWSNINEKSDAINPTNLNTSDPLYSPFQLYRSNSGTLGGDGPNISYEFINLAIKSDTANNFNSTFDFNSGNVTFQEGFRGAIHDVVPSDLLLDLNVNSSNSTGLDVLQEYPLSLPQITYEDMKYPQYNSTYWGYQQNEIYRFGIQFYDKAKNPYFVKWIGDIKFPDITDSCPLSNNIYTDGTQTGRFNYEKSFTTLIDHTTGVARTSAWICQLGIKFEIRIPTNLTEIIGGYSIVRVKREENDKSVIAEGIITSVGSLIAAEMPPVYDPVIGIYRGASPYRGILTPFLDTYDTPEDRVCFFITPNLLDGSLTQPRVNDKLNIRKAFNRTQTAGSGDWTELGTPGIEKYYIYKLYNEINIGAIETHIIDQSVLLPIGNTTTSLNGYIVENADDGGHSLGSNCYYFSFGNNSVNGIDKIYNNSSYKLYATVDRELTNQYGGNTYGDRANNEYIICSHFRPLKTNAIGYTDAPQIFGGDTMNYHIDIQRCIKKWIGGSAPLVSSTFYFPSGACLNAGLRHGTFIQNSLLTDNGLTSSGTETYDYNNVYSAQNDIVKFFPKPDPYIINDEYVNRFVISEIKINGELSDSWSVFKPLNYWDVEGSYGTINACDVLHDQVYFAQDKAFGQLLVNPMTAISGTDGEIIQLGKGDIIDNHKYISTEIGSKHQFSFIKSAYNIFFMDIRHKKIYAFNPGTNLSPESDIKGMHGWCQTHLINSLENTDRPVYTSAGHNGIHGVYDYTNNELIYTIFEYSNDKDAVYNRYTIVYNDVLKAYTADNYSHYPKQYITNHRKFLSPNPLNSTTYKDLYLHNYGNYGEFYGILFDSTIEFLSNKYPEVTKEFTNLMWSTEVQDGTTLIDIDSGLTPSHESFSAMDVSTDHQSNSVIFNILTNLKRRFRTFTTQVPKHSVNSPYVSTGFFARMRDKYLKIKLYYANNSNHRIIVHAVNTFFSVNTPK